MFLIDVQYVMPQEKVDEAPAERITANHSVTEFAAGMTAPEFASLREG